MARNPSWKASLAAGILAGIAGTAAMDAFWRVQARFASHSRDSDESVTTQMAGDLLRRAGVRAPSRQARRAGGKLLHWSYGAAWGAAAGLARAAGWRLDRACGLPLGAALWALGDEWATYRLGYAKPPRAYPPSVHVESAAAHLIYGFGLWAALAAERRLAGSALAEKVRLPKVA